MDRIWLWAYFNNIPIYLIFYLPKRDYRLLNKKAYACNIYRYIVDIRNAQDLPALLQWACFSSLAWTFLARNAYGDCARFFYTFL